MDNLNTQQHWHSLHYLKNKFLFSSLTPNSINTYGSGVKQYLSFCNHLNINPVPPNETILENFVTSLCFKIGAKSMRVYLYGIQYWSMLQGHSIDVSTMDRLDYVIRGIRRWQGNRHIRPDRQPISLGMLRRILAFVDNLPSRLDKLMYKAALTMAFFGMMRISEYTTPTQRAYNPTTHLSPQCVHFSDNFSVLHIYLKTSKTDPFSLGVTVRIGATRDIYCPLNAMAQYLAARPPHFGPLFIHHNGLHLTRRDINNIVQHSLPNMPHVSTHSFRKGGATHYLRAGVSENVIQLIGRWKSDAYKLYLNIPNSFIIDISLAARCFQQTHAEGE